MEKIFLIGMMGSGKSTIGQQLAEQLGFVFCDTDTLIEQSEGVSVAQIFETKGENYFRSLEKAIVAQLPNLNTVVACGGGLPCFGNLMRTLKQTGMVVYLEGQPKVFYERVKAQQQQQQRPLLTDFVQFEALFTERRTCYEQADIVVNAQGRPKEILVEILLETKRKIEK